MPPDPQSKRNLYVFGVTSFLNDTATEMAYWILPAFLSSIGGGPAQLGLIEGIAESVASLGKLFSGYLADRFPRRKPVVVFGYAAANLAKPVLALVTSWWQILLIRFADRAAKGIRGAPRDVMLAESVEKSQLGSAFGLMQAMDSAGAIAGPLIALLMVARWGMRGVFLAAAIPGFLSILVVSLLARETKPQQKKSIAPATSAPEEVGAPQKSIAPNPERGERGGEAMTASPSSSSQAKQEAAGQPPGWRAFASDLPGSFYYMLAAVLIFSLGNSSDMFLILRAQHSGLSVTYVPLLGLVFNVTYTLASWPAGRLGDRMSKPVLAAAGYLIFAAVYSVFAVAPSIKALWVAMAFYGFYYALTSPVLRALVMETVPTAMRGRANGIFFSTTSLTTLLASVITGQLWARFGASLPFYLSAGLAVLAAVMLLGLAASENRESESRRR